jgi:hypothetical protein
VKLSGVVPTFGLGAQVGIGNGWSVLGEVDYICHTKKEGDLKGEDILIDFEPRVGEVGRYGGMFDARVARLTQSTKVKLENKGLAIRFSIVYNVKI